LPFISFLIFLFLLLVLVSFVLDNDVIYLFYIILVALTYIVGVEGGFVGPFTNQASTPLRPVLMQLNLYFQYALLETCVAVGAILSKPPPVLFVLGAVIIVNTAEA
jgi:hypothetical protein